MRVLLPIAAVACGASLALAASRWVAAVDDEGRGVFAWEPRTRCVVIDGVFTSLGEHAAPTEPPRATDGRYHLAPLGPPYLDELLERWIPGHLVLDREPDRAPPRATPRFERNDATLPEARPDPVALPAGAFEAELWSALFASTSIVVAICALAGA